MEQFDRQTHWDQIYERKQSHEVSWFQPVPQTSLDLFKQYNVSVHDSIIDIGGGDSLLVDHLLDAGYTNITVLDISHAAIDRARARLQGRADQVTWIVSDIIDFAPSQTYDCWHDRATFHFLTDELEVEKYLSIARESLRANGLLILGTFSEQGPNKCSGIPIRQYSEETMTALLTLFFQKIKCISVEHKTPADTMQSFIFCSFRKVNNT
jgi:SAM-dependent methyltransferase